MTKRTAKGGKRAKGKSKGKGGRRRHGSILGFLLYWIAVLAVWGVILAMGVVVWYAYDLPDVSKLSVIERKPSLTLLDHRGRTIARFGDIYGEAVQVAELPPHLMQAVVATEDRRFHSHFGIDPIGLARAMVVNLRAGRIVQGGSTISQQLAKNVFLTHQRTLKRKVQEFLLAMWLEANFSKDQILTLYLNRVYLGAGAYGVDAAARRYFAKSARQVNLAEAAMLAGLLKAPSRLAPTGNLKAARNRAAVVLNNMVAAGHIDAAKARRAKQRPAALRPGRSRGRSGRPARYFTDWIVDRLTDFVGPTERDLTVTTTLDRELQQTAEAAVGRLFAGPAGKQRIGQAAVLALAPNGAVRAMVGGRDYAKSQYNRATQARRQPGSAFKPVVYLAGLESGLRPDTVLTDRPVTVGGWSPRNYSGKHVGQVTLTRALAESINTVAVQVSERAGRDRVVEVARRLGIASALPGHPSIALGTAEVSLLELTAAYGALANQGRGVLPHGILEVRDGRGRLLYRRRGSGAGQVVAADDAARLTAMLQAVIVEGTG
ncbi:MAG: transglycosylase domain-containing protein, partial [Alphaproteobacteria bacterium]|nr:transglycosylase domain-containing protein [Alphaproteobacteria bacterium]